MKLESALQRNGRNAFVKAEKIIKAMKHKEWLRFVAGLKRSVREVA